MSDPTVALLERENEALRARVALFEGEAQRRAVAEEALQRSEAKYRGLVETTDTGFVIIDGDGRVADANAEFVRLTGRARLEDILGREVTEWTAEVDRERNALAVRRCLEEGAVRDLDMRYVDASGRVTWVEINATLVDGAGGRHIVTLCRDVTERRRQEAALRDALGDLQRSQRASRLGTYRYDLRADAWTSTAMLDEIVGIDPGYPKTRASWAALIHPADRESVMQYLSHDVLELRQRFDREYRVIRPADGGEAWVRSWGELELAADGAVTAIFGTAQDITERRQTEQTLRESEARLVAAQAVGRVGNWELDLRRNLMWASAEAFRIYGLERTSPHLPLPEVQRLVVPEDRPLLDAALTALVQRRRPYLREFRIRRASDGAMRVIHSEAALELDPDGAPIKAMGVIRDITERHAAEQALRESEQRMRAIFENAGVGIVEVSLDGRLIAANEHLCEVLGYPREQLVGKAVDEITVLEDRPRSQELIGQLCTGALPGFAVEKRYVRASGETLWMRVTASAVRDGEGRAQRFVGVLEDITARKRVEAERERLVEALREADRRKDDFMAVLSHELRNPLTPIVGGIDLLGRAAPGGAQAERARVIIGRQVKQLERLVDDLLDATRIARGKVRLQREPVDVNELVRRTLEDHRALFEESGVALALTLASAPAFASADPARLSQVIGNLLVNAAKFTTAGGSTDVAVAVDRAAGRVSIRVTDTGVGIGPDVLTRLFQPFVQADVSLDRRQGGLGLGLALVKGLVELHDGTVTAHSTGRGQGAEFVVSLPLAAEAVSGHAVIEPAPIPRLRVLLVEDNADAAETLRDMLESGGHEVEVAHDGRVGLARARAIRPDVVLCDLGLPGLNGYEVARAIRADGSLREIRLVAVSGYALPDDVHRAVEAGFEQHVAKPCSLRRLEEVLASLARGVTTAIG